MSALNDTADSGAYFERTNLGSGRNNAEEKESLKRAKRRVKMSYKVQKFIEKKKRETMIKKSLEQTIEVEKQQKIQKNLKNLDKFV